LNFLEKERTSRIGGTVIPAVIAVFLFAAMPVVSAAVPTTVGSAISGTVTNNSGAAIAGATVTLYNTDGSVWQTTTTSSSGFYGFDTGTRCASFVVQVSKAGYWVEKQTVVMRRDPAGCWGTGNARLPADDCSTGAAPLGVMFATWNSGQSRVQYDWSFTLSAQAKVDDYYVGSGQSTTVSNTVTNLHTEQNVRSQIWRRVVCTHGIFWKNNPSNPEHVTVTTATNNYRIDSTWIDYWAAPGPSGGWTWTIGPGASHAILVTSSGTFDLRYEFGVDVSAGIEGIGFSTKLYSHLKESGTGGARSMSITVTNLDTVDHTYKWYIEGNNVYHFWQLS